MPRIQFPAGGQQKFLAEALARVHGKRMKISPPKQIEYLPDHWHLAKAGRMGAIKRAETYGSPGTKEGRSRGGKKSCLVQQQAAVFIVEQKTPWLLSFLAVTINT